MPSLWWGAGLLPLSVLVWRYPPFLPLWFFVFGILWVILHAGILLDASLSPELEKRDIWVEGTVANIPRQTKASIRFEFLVSHSRLGENKVVIPGRILLSAYRKKLAPKIGERWRFKVRLKRPHGFQNPGGFDYEGYLFHKRIRAKGYIRDGVRLPGDAGGFQVGRLRQHIAERFRILLPDNPYTGILTALATGNRNGIKDRQWELLRLTGTNHLMAISGLHIGLIAGLAFFLFRTLWAFSSRLVTYWPAPKAAAVGALFFAACYAALAGFSIPTQRALIMLLVVMAGLLLDRRTRPGVVLPLALMCVLIIDPLAVMSAGFWLSFLAVAVIVIGLQARSRWRAGIFQLISIQLTLAITLIPATLFLFQQASLAAPLANIVAVPIFSLIVIPLVLLSVMASLLLPDMLSAGLLGLAAWVLEGLWQWLEFLSFNIPVLARAVSTPAILISAAGVALLLAPRAMPARWLGCFAVLPLFFSPVTVLAPGELVFTLMDVGQGLAAVLRTRNHLLVYDTGPRYSSRFDTGQAVVVPYLHHLGRDKIDLLIISHGDNDHIGGARSVRQQLNVVSVLSSVPERLNKAETCYAGQHWRWDGVDFRILSPRKGAHGADNNASCVLRVESKNGSVLLPGDIEAEQEELLVQEYGRSLRSDVMVAPHHGSKTSSISVFIDNIQPKWVLFATGYRNRYHHPHPRVVARYRSRRILMLDSPRQGAVEVRFNPEGLQITSFRQQHRRYWFDRESRDNFAPERLGLLN